MQRHSDGYWYVYEGIATQPQSPITITGVPDETAYGDTFKLNATGGSTNISAHLQKAINDYVEGEKTKFLIWIY